MPRWPSKFSSGTVASANDSSRVSDARQPILLILLAAREARACLAGTMRFEISGLPSGRVPVTAVIVVPPVMSVPELVMKAFVPLMTQLPSRSSACVGTFPGVAAGVGLGQPEAPEHLALRQRHEVALLLLLRAEEVERRGAERDVRGHRDRGRRVGARDLHDGERVADRVGAGAAVLLGKRQPHEAELAIFARGRTETRSSRSISSARGFTSSRANSRARLWIALCSSVRSKSMAEV